MNAAPTPIPIEDIAGLWEYFPYPVWLVAASGAVVLLLIGWLLWFFVFRSRPQPVLSAIEWARRELAGAAADVDNTDPYTFGIRVSDTLRVFIEAQTGLRATTQTSMEFLAEIRDSPVFSADEKAALSLFLERSDLIKFARAHATSEDSRQLLDSAQRIVEAPRNERESK